MFKDGRYTKIFLKHAMPIRSLYSVRLYELLLQYKKSSKREFKIDELRFHLSIPKNRHKQWCHLKQHILQPAQNHLVKYTDIKFDFCPKKEGKKVIGVNFIIFTNTPEYNCIQTELFVEKSISNNNSLHDENANYVKIIRENLWLDSQEEALNKFSPETIEYYFDYAKKMEASGLINNFKGFFYHVLFEDKENHKQIVKIDNEKLEKIINDLNNGSLIKSNSYKLLPKEIKNKCKSKAFLSDDNGTQKAETYFFIPQNVESA